jgi:N-carbamoyl-L-amino-acid hydrolase
MNRRHFAHRLALAIGGLGLSPSLLASAVTQALRVNGQRLNTHIRELARFGRLATGGINRVAFGEADLEAREYVKGLMRAAGLEVAVDAAGNIIGRKEGRAGGGGGAQPLMLGSHIDSVPQGGNYDGPVGTLGAIEAVQTLAEKNIVTRHPLEVAVFVNEESGKTGSRVMSGELDRAELDLVTHSGHTMREGIRILGGDPDKLSKAKRKPGSIAAYLELHVEQGALLEGESIDIGVVEGIVGIKRWRVTIDGFANHAGTTPMNDRRDALLAAADFIKLVNRVVTGVEGRQVGTVGQAEVLPGAPNVIPGQVKLSLEIRDLDMGKIDALYQTIESESQKVAKATQTTFALDQYYVSKSAPTNEGIRRMITDAAAELGHSTLHMPSGAGHDAQSIALLAPIGMIFIPSVGGISHSPQEFSRPEDITAGANVLLNTLLRLDEGSPAVPSHEGG